MRQIEITVRLIEKVEDVIAKLESHGFKKIREGDVDDIYLANSTLEIKKENISEILKHSVLLRKFTINDKEVKKITYKNKELDANGDVIAEQKINLDYEDLDKAEQLFKCLGLYNLVEVKYHFSTYEKDGKEFSIHEVENLGTVMEYENNEDFTGKSTEEIKVVKIKMQQEIRDRGISITDEYDVKKALELIIKKYCL